jgi:hypothetical protein
LRKSNFQIGSTDIINFADSTSKEMLASAVADGKVNGSIAEKEKI